MARVCRCSPQILPDPSWIAASLFLSREISWLGRWIILSSSDCACAHLCAHRTDPSSIGSRFRLLSSRCARFYLVCTRFVNLLELYDIFFPLGAANDFMERWSSSSKKIHERYGKEKIDVYIKVEGENVKLRLWYE